jgi:N-acetylmuramoyl-L-alanine amidase
MATLAFIDCPSPNHDGRGDRRIDMLILHYTGMTDFAAARDRLTDPAAKVSAHYLIGEDGRCFAMVPEHRRAWHAGRAYWRGETDINACSIGIELHNPGHEFGYRPFADGQMACLKTLAADIVARHEISPARVLGHSDVAPERKQDPGELFDWAGLAAAGIGVWPVPPPSAEPPPDLAPGIQGGAVLDLQLAFDAIGYRIEGTGAYDQATEAVVAAFQRHFRPARVDGLADAETQALLWQLLPAEY